jgi:hypothetical protein
MPTILESTGPDPQVAIKYSIEAEGAWQAAGKALRRPPSRLVGDSVLYHSQARTGKTFSRLVPKYAEERTELMR